MIEYYGLKRKLLSRECRARWVCQVFQVVTRRAFQFGRMRKAQPAPGVAFFRNAALVPTATSQSVLPPVLQLSGTDKTGNFSFRQ